MNEKALLEFCFERRLLKAANSDEKVVLSNSELHICWLLWRAYGDVISRAELLTQCWSGKVVTESSLNVAIKNVRQALVSLGVDIEIHTVPRVGYQMRNTPLTAGRDAEPTHLDLENKPRSRFSLKVRSVFCLVLPLLIWIVLFELICILDKETKGRVEVVSYGIDIEQPQFQWLNALDDNIEKVFLMPAHTPCREVQIVVYRAGQLQDVTDDYQLSDCMEKLTDA